MQDVISLSIGEPDFSTPWHVRQKGIETLEKGKPGIPQTGGLRSQEEISRWLERKYGLRYDPQKSVLVTVGGSEAIDLCLRSVIRPGDEVLIPEPSFVCYVPLTQMAGESPL